MTAAQAPYLVTGILILVTSIIGKLLGRAGKPYGKGKLVLHVFFGLWLTVGVAYILNGRFATGGTKGPWIPDAFIGLMILVQIGTGIMMMARKEPDQRLPRVHTVATVLMLLVDIYAFIVAG